MNTELYVGAFIGLVIGVIIGASVIMGLAAIIANKQRK